jgi:hypothetical protein
MQVSTGKAVKLLLIIDVGAGRSEWSASRSGSVLPRERTPGTHWTGGWVDLRAGLNTEATGKIPCPCRGSKVGRPVSSQTLY